MPKSAKVSKVAEVVLSESEDEVMSGGEEEKQVVVSDSESDSDTDSDTSDDEQAGGAKKKPVKKAVKKEPVKKAAKSEEKPKAKKAAKSQEEEPKAKKAAKSQEADDDKPAKKPARSRKAKTDDDKPKKELNPIMKEMNKFRNEVIGAHLGTKMPMKTIPPFKEAMKAARKQLKMEEKDKNTVEVVQKASELFKANPSKYCD
jgi:hypothetical protein